jgi:hypothetical protein
VTLLDFVRECLLLQLKCDLLETPEIAKILCDVYKGSCIAKYPLKQLFTVDLPCSECSPQIKDHIQVDERHL